MSTPENASMKSMPADADWLRRKYAEERVKRLRPDGRAQYQRLSEDMLTDPFAPPADRESRTDHVTFTFIGGGIAGVLAGTRVRQAGIEDVRIIDSAGDFGGVWYWNRYPGAMCDSPSLVYLPLLEETGYVPTRKWVYGPEILGHLQRVGRQFGLYDNALFHTKVEEIIWQDEDSRWLVITNRGDRFTTSYIGMGPGPLAVQKLPGVSGIGDFAGKWFHTSRWDYEYTGGSPDGAPMDKLREKRVAVIGTGATGVQVVPQLARDAGELFVFQRTPSAVDARDNAPIDPEWFQSIATPGWQQRLHENFIVNYEGFFGRPGPDVAVENLMGDNGFCKLAQRFRSAMHAVPPEEFSLERIAAAVQASDDAVMEAIRARIDAIVEDPATAEKLKPWYSQMCKRPCYHDEYLQAFNRSNTHLVDTDGKGVERITRDGVVANGVEHKVDLVVYASGFDLDFSVLRSLTFKITGRAGLALTDAWADGSRTLHGMHVHGFPNLFLVQQAQGAFFGLNITTGWAESARTIASVVGHAVNNGYREVEPTLEAQDAWVDLHLTAGTSWANQDCTPGILNNEGEKPDPYLVAYPAGSEAFFAYIHDWCASGDFDGLKFS
jgi:cation diffusion facilitator CzcD-associated flavoprotein CzcO